MTQSPKSLVLLEAYEELTAKESFCLKEVNIKGVLATQEKKAKLLAGFRKLEPSEELSEEAKADFDRRIQNLLEREAENSKALESLIEENRLAYKLLSKHRNSASNIRKAYGAKSSSLSNSKSLKDQA